MAEFYCGHTRTKGEERTKWRNVYVCYSFGGANGTARRHGIGLIFVMKVRVTEMKRCCLR